ncbi:MAG: chemotaxis response regulator protein-glutamate methylesterase [Brevinematales bacterium]|jgi:two-component system chemotaxis response regulator CheB
MVKKIRVLIVDDSALVRDILDKGLSADPDIEVVGKAMDVYAARDKIVYMKPDVITLDVEMPRMDGVEFLKRLMPQYPLPVVMVSSMTKEGSRVTLDALEAGAVDFVLKPSINIGIGLKEMINELAEKIKIASTVDVSKWKEVSIEEYTSSKYQKVLEGSTDKVIGIGASTGGTVALTKIINAFPTNIPGTVVVQHMPPGFTRLFAESLNKSSKVEVAEAKDGDRIIAGRVLIAPGGYQLNVRRSGGQYRVHCYEAEKVNGHAPSVDVLFYSIAGSVGANAIGVILTGMGRDGADGMLAMRKTGARTIAQDEASSVVYGMPKEAFKNGGAEKQVNLSAIPSSIYDLLAGIRG